MMISKFTEAAIKKDITKATNKFIKEHTASFKNDLTLTVSYPSPLTAEVRVDFNTFKSCSNEDSREIEMMEQELTELETGALNVSSDRYHAGLIAASLIKHGKILDCSCLMSYVTATFTYASNFK